MPGVFGGFGYVHKDGRVYGLFEGQPLDDTGQPANSFGEVYMVDLDDRAHASRVAYDSESPREWLFGPDGAVLANAEYDKKTGDWRLYARAPPMSCWRKATTSSIPMRSKVTAVRRQQSSISRTTRKATARYSRPLRGRWKAGATVQRLEQASPAVRPRQ